MKDHPHSQPDDTTESGQGRARANPLPLILASVLALGALGLVVFSWQKANQIRSGGNETKKPKPPFTSENPLDLMTILPPPTQEQIEKDQKKVEQFRRTNTNRIEVNFAGVENPRFVNADAVLLPDSVEVLGITTNGISRAYLLAGMSTGPTHVVHDQLSGLPVTITYCDINDCVLAHHRQDIEPHEYQMGGWDGKEMTLVIQGKRYPLTDPDIPLASLPIERTTWKEWKTRFPETKIFLGIFHPKD